MNGKMAMFNGFDTRTVLAAATLAVLTAAGAAPASAAPWDHRHDIQRFDRHDRFEHRRFVDRVRVNEMLRPHRYRVLGDPYFVRGHYVVRSHDRFGRQVFVEVNPRSGAFIGEMRL